MKTNLCFSSCVGRVVHYAVFIKTFTTGGSRQCVSVTNRRGFFDPTKFHATVWVHTSSWTRTGHVRRVEFIVQDEHGFDHSFWVEGYEDFFLREGQRIALLSANGRPVRVANFTANETYNFCTGAEVVAGRQPFNFLASAALIYGATMALCYLLGGVLTGLGAGTQARAEHLLGRVGSIGNPVLLLLLVVVTVRLGYGAFSRCRRIARVRLANREIASAWSQCLTFPRALVSHSVP